MSLLLCCYRCYRCYRRVCGRCRRRLLQCRKIHSWTIRQNFTMTPTIPRPRSIQSVFVSLSVCLSVSIVCVCVGASLSLSLSATSVCSNGIAGVQDQNIWWVRVRVADKGLAVGWLMKSVCSHAVLLPLYLFHQTTTLRAKLRKYCCSQAK